MRRMLWVGMLLGVLACLLTGCGGGTASSTLPPVTLTIGGGGGTLVGGNATLSVPPNTVTTSALFSVQPTTTYPADSRVVPRTAYLFSTTATTLSSSMQITIRYNGALLSKGMLESGLRLFQVVNGVWTAVSGSTVDTNNKLVTGSVTTLGTFAVLATNTTNTTTTNATTKLLYLSDSGGLIDVDGKAALLLYSGTFGPGTTVTTTAEISTYGGASTGLGTETIKHAEFSPDGTQVVYESRSPSGNAIVVANSDGTSPTVIFTATALSSGTLGLCRAPSFSTDGKTIVFIYNITGTDQIYTVNVDGTSPTQLTTTLTSSSTIDNPFYTKAGNIRFVSTKSGVTTYNLMGPDGSNLTTTTTFGPSVTSWRNYSPDGTKIAYVAQSSGKYEVFLMNSDGSNATQLTKLSAYAIGSVRFSADSAKVIFDVATSSTALHQLD